VFRPSPWVIHQLSYIHETSIKFDWFGSSYYVHLKPPLNIFSHTWPNLYPFDQTQADNSCCSSKVIHIKIDLRKWPDRKPCRKKQPFAIFSVLTWTVKFLLKSPWGVHTHPRWCRLSTCSQYIRNVTLCCQHSSWTTQKHTLKCYELKQRFPKNLKLQGVTLGCRTT